MMNNNNQDIHSRRELLKRSGIGAGLLASASSLAPASEASSQRQNHTPKAKQLVHLFMNGGPSQMDTFDPKPLLQKYHGKPLPNKKPTERKTSGGFASPFKFKKYGQSGTEVSELFQNFAQHMDDVCVVRSMQSDVPNHEPALLLMNCGDNIMPRPSLGSWLNYGLGSMNENLPGYIVLCPGGHPTRGPDNWGSAFLPSSYQGVHINTQHRDVSKLINNIKSSHTADVQRRQIDLLQNMNRRHLKARGHHVELESRMKSFEMAYRMQFEASKVFDIDQEPKYIRDMYGDGIQGRQLLMTRRLLEKGVRCIQVWHGAGGPWDHHDNLVPGLKDLCGQWDKPLAAFMTDLKQRGMLDETVVMWGGEFGRTPVAEMPKMSGRDHNHYGYSIWLAGGGVKGGHVHGATDELGFEAVKDNVHVHDLHATLLHLMGVDHTKLTYRYAGRDFRLTDVHGEVVLDILT